MCSHEKVDETADGTRPLELLEREICELAAQIHAQTCRWLCLVGEYDAREGWGQWGCLSCAHWVSYTCAIAPGAAREHVRVARRLRELPLIREAFAAGQLSYSKVRALTRVENIAREQDLVDLARAATASQLERLVRAYRGVVRRETAARGGGPERWLTWSHDDDGSLLLSARLPAEEGAQLIAALEAATDAARNEPRDRDVPAGTRDGQTDGLQDVPAGTHDSASDDRGDVPAGTPDDREDVPAGTPDRAGDDRGGVSAGTSELTVGERRADALVALADTFLAAGPVARTGGDRHQVVVHVDAATLSGSDGESGLCELDGGEPLAPETVRRLACDGAIVRLLEHGQNALDVGRKTRAIPPALQRALAARDRGCRFPGCQARRFVDAHHIVHWAHGGATKLANLIQLCRRHHGLLHEGGYTLTRSPAGEPIFRRPDGRRIPTCPTLPEARPARPRPGIDDWTCRPTAGDQRLDLVLGVDAMFAFAPLATGEPPGI